MLWILLWEPVGLTFHTSKVDTHTGSPWVLMAVLFVSNFKPKHEMLYGSLFLAIFNSQHFWVYIFKISTGQSWRWESTSLIFPDWQEHPSFMPIVNFLIPWQLPRVQREHSPGFRLVENYPGKALPCERDKLILWLLQSQPSWIRQNFLHVISFLSTRV